MKRSAPRAQAHRPMACTLLRRSIGNRADRVAYGGGFEDLADGRAKCMPSSVVGLSALQVLSPSDQMSRSLKIQGLMEVVVTEKGPTSAEYGDSCLRPPL